MATAHDLLEAASIRLANRRAGEQRAACPKCASIKIRAYDNALAVLLDERGVAWLCHRCGWKSGGRTESIVAGRSSQSSAQAEVRKRERAASIWRSARVARGTIVEHYLRVRGVTCIVPECIRFHESCPRREERLPAMVALMVDICTNTFRAIHRTYLERDGSRKVLLGAAKMMYASTTGACIKLTPDEDVTYGLGICEGIETGLSLISIGWRSVWAVGSARAIEAFPVLSGVEHLTIFADSDEVGLSSARVCTQRWRAMRRETRIIYPRRAGEDWNDVVRQRDGLSAAVQAGTRL